MPWYWSDDLAKVLVTVKKLDRDTAAAASLAPVAFRSEKDSIEDAAIELAEEGEIPLAA